MKCEKCTNGWINTEDDHDDGVIYTTDFCKCWRGWLTRIKLEWAFIKARWASRAHRFKG